MYPCDSTLSVFDEARMHTELQDKYLKTYQY